MQNRPALGIALMVAAMLMLSAMDAGTKWLTQTYAIPQIQCVRFWIFLCVALVIARPAGGLRALRSPRVRLQIGRSLVLVVEMMVFIYAFSIMPLADVHGIAAATPLIAMTLAAFFLRERIGPHRIASVLVGFVGVMLIIRPGTGMFDVNALIPLAAALLWACYQILLRLVARTDGPETTLLWTAVVGCVVFSTLAPFDWRWPDAEGWGLMLLVGLMGSAGHYLLIRALDAAPAAVLQPYNYVLLVGATLMGWLVFDHLPDAWTVSGAMIVVAGGLYALYRERLRKGEVSSR